MKHDVTVLQLLLADFCSIGVTRCINCSKIWCGEWQNILYGCASTVFTRKTLQCHFPFRSIL